MSRDTYPRPLQAFIAPLLSHPVPRNEDCRVIAFKVLGIAVLLRYADRSAFFYTALSHPKSVVLH